MDCINRDAKRELVSQGHTLSKPDKRAIIAHILKENPSLVPALLQLFEPRVTARYNPVTNSFSVGDTAAEHLASRIYAQLEEVLERDTVEGNSVAFHEDTHDLRHLSNTAIVNQLLASVPLLRGEGPATVDGPGRFTSNEFVNPVQAKDLLWRLARKYGYVLDYPHLEELLRLPLETRSMDTSHAEDMLLMSLHRFLFGKQPLEYRDMYGRRQSRASVWAQHTQHESREVRERNGNMLANLLITVASVNDLSSLSYATDREVFKAINDGTTEVRANMNRSIAFRLFDVSEQEGSATVRLSQSALGRLKDAQVGIREHAFPDGRKGFVVSALVDNVSRRGTLSATTPKVWVHIPFELSANKREGVAVVRDFDAFLATDPLAGDRSVYDNAHTIKQLLDLTGYADAVDSVKVYEDFLANPKRQPARPLEQLYRLAANNLMAVSMMAYDQQKATQRLNDYSPFPAARTIEGTGRHMRAVSSEAVTAIGKAIQDWTANSTPERNQQNISKTLQKVFGSEADLKRVQTFVNSPLMFFVDNRALAGQLMESRGQSRNQAQFNVSNDLVNKNTIAGNVEHLLRKFRDIRAIRDRGEYTVFADDIYINDGTIPAGGKPEPAGTVTPRAEIVDMFRLDGYKASEEAVGKGQMRMNEQEINHLVHRYFAESIIQHYDRRRNEATRGDYFPEVNSDKSAFVGHSIRTTFNQFPLKTIQVGNQQVRTVDVDKMIGTLYAVEQTHRKAFATQFKKAWAESGLLGQVDANLDTEALLSLIESTPLPPSGNVPLLFNKYWVTRQENGVKYFKVKEEVKAYLRPLPLATRRRQLLEAFAVNHKQMFLKGGQALGFTPAHLAWLANFRNEGTGTALVNPDTGAPVRQAPAGGIYFNPQPQPYEVGGKTDEQLLRDMALLANPFEVAHFFNHLTLAPPLSRFLTGEAFQYKGETWHEMLKDRLKRSVQSVAPQTKMSLDTQQRTPGDRRLTRHSYTLQVDDELFQAVDVLGAGLQGPRDRKEVYDGGSLTFELAEIMYQASYGGIHGLFPKASWKFFYGHTDNVSGDNLLMKYAVHRISSEWVRQGSDRVDTLLKLFMGTVPLGRPVHVDVTFGEHALNAQYGPNETLYHVYRDLLATGTPMNPFQLLADIIASNANPETGVLDLKDKYVSQIVFKSSAKTGQKAMHTMADLAARVAEAEAFETVTGQRQAIRMDAKEFNVIDNVDLGIQLDASHSPDNMRIAMVSQAITAGVLENRTPALAKEMLDTLSQLSAKGTAWASRAISGDFSVEDTYAVTVQGPAGPRQTTAKASQLTFTEDGDELFAGDPVLDKQLLEKKHLAFDDLRLKGITLEGYPNLHEKDTFLRYQQDPGFRGHARRLFLRALALKSMDRQGIYNTTYMAVEQNTFDTRDPAVEKLVLSAVNTFINKNAISLSLSGGNYVLTPTYGLIQVYEAVHAQTGEPAVVMKSEIASGAYRPAATDADGKPQGRELKWKGYVDVNGQSITARDKDGVALNPVYREYDALLRHYRDLKAQGADEVEVEQARVDALYARQELQAHLSEYGWTAEPAEFILPYSFKKNFGLRVGMQPQQVTPLFFFNRLTAMDKKRRLLREMLATLAEDAESRQRRALLMQRYGTAYLEAVRNEQTHLEEILTDFNWSGEKELALEEAFTRLFPQLDPTAVAADIAGRDAQLMAQAELMHADFLETLQVIVNRIPNSGMQSIVTGQIVGFLEGNENAILIPTELMILQGADLDIDKATVQMQEVSDEGRIHRPVRNGDGSVNYALSSAEALANHVTNLMAAINNAPENAIQSNTPVGFDRLGAQRDKREKDGIQFHPDRPYTIVQQKILTAEGKAMTGLEANGLKMFALTYFLRQQTGKPLRPLRLARIRRDRAGAITEFTMEPYNDIANVDPRKLEDQVWEIYSELVNAATDNAKEMILGAIGANLQSGNIINAMVMYGMEADDIFSFLSDPFVEPVILRLRHSANIDSARQRVMTIEDGVREELLAFYGKEARKEAAAKTTRELLDAHADPIQTSVFESLLKMGAVAEEFAIGASMLAINRGLPVSMFDKFNYRQKLENYLNKRLDAMHTADPDSDPEVAPFRFDFARFINDDVYALAAETAIERIIPGTGERAVEAVNILSLLRRNPHIRAFLKAKGVADDTLQHLAPIHRKAQALIAAATAGSENRYKNVNEDEYNALVRYLTEVQTHEFVKAFDVTLPAVTDGTPLRFDLRKNEHVSAFVYYFPDYLMQLRDRNPDTVGRNRFFQALAKKTDAKGQYLHIPNIDQLAEGALFDLRFALNNQRAMAGELRTAGAPTTYNQLLKDLFLYSLIVGKGKVSKSSFFELFEPGIKEEMGYTAFYDGEGDLLRQVPTDPDAVAANLHVQLALARFAPYGGDYVHYPTRYNPVTDRDEEQRDLDTYSVSLERPADQLPPVVSLYRNGSRQLYMLSESRSNRSVQGKVEYSVVKPMFPLVALSANTDGRPTHTTANRVRKTVTDPRTIEGLLRGEPTAFEAAVPGRISDTVLDIVTNIGTVRVDRVGQTGQLMASRLLGNASAEHQAFSQSAVQEFIGSMTERLQARFPYITVKHVDSDEMARRFGEDDRDSVGMADNDTIYFNMDRARPDMPMHEFGHVYMWLLKETNPDLYEHITSLALEEDGELARQVRARYGDLDGARLGEEIFVTMVGYKSVDELRAAHPAMRQASWVRRMWEAMGEFFEHARRFLADITGADRAATLSRLHRLDLQTATMWDFVNSVSYEMLHGDIRDNLPRDAYERMAFRTAPKKARGAADLLRLLITDHNSRALPSQERAKQMRTMMGKLQRYVRNNMENRDKEGEIFKGYEYDQLATLTERLFPDEVFDKYTDNLYTLDELVKKKEITSVTGTHKAKVDFTGLTFDDPNVLVRTSILGDQVVLELIDLAGKSEKLYNRHLKRSNLAGAFIGDTAWRQLGGTFKAKQSEVDHLRLGVYGVQLRDAGGKKIKVGSVKSVNTSREQDKDWVKGNHMHEVLANLRALTKVEGLRDMLSGPLQGLLAKEELLDPDTYTKDLVRYYRDFIHRMAAYKESSPKNAAEYKAMDSLVRKAQGADELIAALTERQAVLLGRDSKNGMARTGKTHAAERRVISEALLQLHNVRDLYRTNQDNYVNSIQRYLDNPTDSGAGLLTFVQEKVAHAMNRVRETVMNGFKPEHARLQEALISDYRSQNPLSLVEDWTLNDARKFFEPMLERRTATDESGNRVEVFTGRFVADDSALTANQKAYKKFFEEQVARWHKEMYARKGYSESYDVRGLVPLMKMSSDSALKDMAGDILTGEANRESMKEQLDRAWESNFNNAEFYQENIDSRWIDDRFRGQFDVKKGQGPLGNDARLNILGLMEENGELKVFDREANRRVETDLSMVLDMFVSNAAKKAEFTKVVPLVESFRDFVTTRNMAHGITTDKSLETFNDSFDRFVNTKTREDENWKEVNQILNKGTGIASMAMLGLKYTVNVANWATGFSANFKEAFFNSAQKLVTGEGKHLFNAADVAWGEAMVLKDWEKMNALNGLYGFNQMDFQNMNHERFRPTNMAKFGSRFTYGLNFIGDAYNRNVLFAAQMRHDGSYAAYEMQEGKLVYDERKDRRFFGSDGSQTEQQKALHAYFRKALQAEGGIDGQGRMTRGYDNKTRGSMKLLSDKIHGSYDNEMASNLNNYALGRMWLVFGRYLQNKIKQYITGGRMGPYMSDINGELVERRAPDGTLYYEWQGTMAEGIWVTLIQTAAELAKFRNPFKEMQPHQKRNLLYVATDVMLLVILSNALTALFGDEEELKKKSPLKAALVRGFLDPMRLGVDPRIYVRKLTEPFVTVTWWSKQLDNTVAVAAGDVTRLDDMASIIPPLSRINITVRTLDDVQKELE